ncbi:MAG: DUF1778 domain-containing protein [Mycobacterium sp.]
MSTADDQGPRTDGDEHLTLHVNAEDRLLIREAAIAADRTVADFVLSTALDSARRIVVDRSVFVATEDQWAEFESLLSDDRKPMPTLDRLLRRASPFAEEIN